MSMKKTTIKPEDWAGMEKRIAKKRELKTAHTAAIEDDRKAKANKQKAETRALQRACQKQKNLIAKRKKLENKPAPAVRPELQAHMDAMLAREKWVNELNELLVKEGLAHPDSARHVEDSWYV